LGEPLGVGMFEPDYFTKNHKFKEKYYSLKGSQIVS